MSEKLLWKFRASVWRDKSIPPRAAILLLNITDKIFRDPTAAFPLSDSEAARLCGLADRVNGRGTTQMLVEAGWLTLKEIRGCPPTSFYTLSNGGKNTSINDGKFTSINGGKKTIINGGKDASNHISNSFQEVMKETMRKKSSSLRSKKLASGGKNKSSLRSEYGMGVENSGEMTPAQRKAFFDKHKKEAGLI